MDSDTTISFQLTVNDGITKHSDFVDITISDVSGSSTLPLIANPFPDENDNFGYAVSGNDGIILVGTPFEDLVEFPDVSSMILSDVTSQKIFSFRNSDGTIAYLTDMNNPSTSFAIKSYEINLYSDDMMSLTLLANYTTGLLSLMDNANAVVSAVYDVTPENNNGMTLGHTIHNGIIAFTDTITNSTILFDGASGIPLTQVAQNAGAAYLFDGAGNLVHAIPNPSAGSSDQFGHTITPFGDSGFVIGAIESDVGSTNAGAAYLYDDIADQSPKVLTADNPDTADEFGYAIASDGTIILIGSPEAANGGLVTIFDGMTGTRLHTITNPTGKSGDDFGESVGVNNNSIYSWQYHLMDIVSNPDVLFQK